MWRKGNFCALLVSMKIVIFIMEIEWSFLKKLKVELLYDPVIPVLGISEENEIAILKIHLYPHVYSSIIYYNQIIETT